MATSKTTNKTTSTTSTTAKIETPKAEEVKVETPKTETPSVTDQMLEMMKNMQSQLSSLTNELASTKAELASTKQELNEAKEKQVTEDKAVEITSTPIHSVMEYNPSPTEKFIEILANRKSDKEVTIVHNREIVGGGTTHLNLPNLVLDFKHMGESRTVSMLQFEACISSYRGFFNREILLVADKDREIAEEYGVPCMKRPDGYTLTRTDINKMPTMSVTALTDLYNKLTPNDKKFMLNYWLGQCYNRTPGFYDRYKIETLNALSGNGVFDTLIAFMNGESLNSNRGVPEQINNTNNQQQNNIVGKAEL